MSSSLPSRLHHFIRSSSTITSFPRPPSVFFSGIQPTGVPHLGNFFGFIQPWIRVQQEAPPASRFYLSVVDLHAISTGPVPAHQLREDVYRMTASLLASGVDPEKTILFQQSHVAEHALLFWTLGALQTSTKLQRLPQYKEKAAKYAKGAIPVGLLTYPLLQAADVLLYRASKVVVGEDQSQHMNLMRDLAESFNGNYSTDFFPVPEQVTIGGMGARVRSLRDPSLKMSKSDPANRSRISLDDTKTEVEEKCRRAVSDFTSSISFDPVQRPAVSNLVSLYALATDKTLEEVVEVARGMNTMEFKQALAERLNEMLEPIREKFAKIKKKEVEEVLGEGARKARKDAGENWLAIRSIVGFS